MTDIHAYIHICIYAPVYTSYVPMPTSQKPWMNDSVASVTLYDKAEKRPDKLRQACMMYIYIYIYIHTHIFNQRRTNTGRVGFALEKGVGLLVCVSEGRVAARDMSGVPPSFSDRFSVV